MSVPNVPSTNWDRLVSSPLTSSHGRSLKEQKNLNSFFAVMFGVSNTAVSRLAKTWEVTAHGLLPPPLGSAVTDPSLHDKDQGWPSSWVPT